MPRVMVLGASGMLGQGVCQILEGDPNFRVTRVTRENLGILESWGDVCTQRGFDYVINCVGAIHQRQPPWTEKDYWETNCQFPKMVMHKARRRGSRLIHISTDAVFSGTTEKSCYLEGDLPDPTDVYAYSKLGCEQFLIWNGALVIRTSILGRNRSQRGGLIPSGLYEWFRNEVRVGSKTIPGWGNHWSNGVTTREFGRVCKRVISEPGDFWDPGLVHLFSPEVLNKYQLFRMFARHLGVDPGVVQETKYPRRMWRILGTTKTWTSKMEVRPLKDQISDLDNL